MKRISKEDEKSRNQPSNSICNFDIKVSVDFDFTFTRHNM